MWQRRHTPCSKTTLYQPTINPESRAKLTEIEHNLAGLPSLESVSPTLRTAFIEQRRVWDDERSTLLRQLAQQPIPPPELDCAEISALAKTMLESLQTMDRHAQIHQLREILNKCVADIHLHFQPVTQGKRTLCKLEKGELTFLAKPGRLLTKVNRGDRICPVVNVSSSQRHIVLLNKRKNRVA